MELLNIKGFNVLHEQKPGELASVRLIVNAGSIDETDPADHGTAHYLEHMFFKGTEKKDYKQINNEMAMLGDANAYTSFDRTVYYMSCLSGDYYKALELLMEMLCTPAFLEEEFDKEKTVIVEEYQARQDNPGMFFSTKALEHAMGTKGHSIIGSKEAIEGKTLKHLHDFRNENYNKSNTYIAIIGDISGEQLMADCGGIFDKYQDMMKPGKPNERKADIFVPGTDFDFTHAAAQAMMSLVYTAWPDADLESCGFVSDVFENGLGGGLHSLLFNRLREELGLCYSISAGGSGCGGTGMTNLFAMLDSRNVDLAHDEIEKVLKGVCKDGFSETLLSVAKKNTVFDLASTLNGPGGYARVFCDRYAIAGHRDFATIKKAIENITNEDIIKYANWMSEPGHQLICMNR